MKIMNKMDIKKMYEKMMVMVVAGLLLTLLSSSGSLGLTPQVLAKTTIDTSKKGSISLTLQDSSTGDVLMDGVLTLYKVADVSTDSTGNYVYTFTEDFADCGLSLDNISSSELAKDLASWVTENDIEGTEENISSDGTVTFSDLSVGLYLIVQTTDSTGYYTLDPFLVSIPLEEGLTWVYDVDASPKIEPAPIPPSRNSPPEETITDTPPEETTSETPSEETTTETSSEETTTASESATETSSTTESSSFTTSSSNSTTSSKTSTTTTTKKSTLPQTGQLNWPIPILALGGLFLLLFGYHLTRLEKGNGNDDHEI